MHKIFDANKEFPLENLVLTTPIVITSGIYFIKYLIDNESLYIQPPKCITRQGIIKGSKKMYCDLLFTNENNTFIQWIEDLENYSHSYIFKNRERWFDSQLELEDIADSFLPILKIYKSGKYYILRTIVPGNANDCLLKLYDENENQVNPDLLTESTNVIPILEFKGIKCTSRNFQVDIEIRQMMIIKPTLLFERCVIKNNGEPLGNNLNEPLSVMSTTTSIIVDNKDNIQATKIVAVKEENKNDINEISLDNVKNEYSGLLEVDLDNESINNSDVITLTNRDEVYYKIYQEAMNKAKEAKKLAISSYMQAKQIKNLYMLDDVDDYSENIGDIFDGK